VSVSFHLNGDEVSVADGVSLLDALREELCCRSVKDGCSPQGQCGCCTVWVDGAPRVSCVTPVRRIAGRHVTTLEGIGEERRRRWATAFVARGASQCGFCTPGIVMRLAALEESTSRPQRREIEAALRAHLCRCTGWQSIVEAASEALGLDDAAGHDAPDPDTALHPDADTGGSGSCDGGPPAPRDPLLASWRAQVEGPAFQSSGPDVVLGGGGFADDTAPPDALVQLGAAAPLAPGLRAARAGTGRVQGRNSTVSPVHPVDVPPGEWDLTLRTTWVEPAYLEPDASWCRPGGVPAWPLANGGAFGGKRHSPVPARARELADQSGQAVRVVWRREDVVRHGPKRPPVAVALRADGSGVVRLGCPPGSADLSAAVAQIRRVCPGVEVEVAAVAGPPVGPELRAAGWAETLAALHALRAPTLPAGCGQAHVALPGAGSASVDLRLDEGGRGRLRVDVWAGAPTCPVTLRSYVLGAVHQALGMVWSEGIAVDAAGEPLDLTIRSFGILTSRDMPEVEVRLHEEDRWPVNGSDAVFVATLAAAWIAEGLPGRWPTRRAAVRAPRRETA
jgi:xanthine dehydrogenase small subunit